MIIMNVITNVLIVLFLIPLLVIFAAGVANLLANLWIAAINAIQDNIAWKKAEEIVRREKERRKRESLDRHPKS